MIVLAAFCATQSKTNYENSDNLSTTAQFKSELPVQLESELDAQFHRNMHVATEQRTNVKIIIRPKDII